MRLIKTRAAMRTSALYSVDFAVRAVKDDFFTEQLRCTRFATELPGKHCRVPIIAKTERWDRGSQISSPNGLIFCARTVFFFHLFHNG
jgi:hypothetical protein